MMIDSGEQGSSANGHHVLGGHANAGGTTLITSLRRLWLPWLPRQREPDRAARWLRAATLALGALAAAAAIVSWDAQYRMVYAYKHSAAIAALQAGIPDAGALVFASLGIALALRGRQAARARILNVACVAISIAMNALAATPGGTALAIWVMAPVLYALASDTLIGVIRTMADGSDDSTPLAVAGRIALWSARLLVAPRSTAVGARRMVLAATPLPDLPATPAAGPAVEIEAAPAAAADTKKARLLALYKEHEAYGDRSRASRVAGELAEKADLQPGTARTYINDHLREGGEAA